MTLLPQGFQESGNQRDRQQRQRQQQKSGNYYHQIPATNTKIGSNTGSTRTQRSTQTIFPPVKAFTTEFTPRAGAHPTGRNILRACRLRHGNLPGQKMYRHQIPVFGGTCWAATTAE